MTERRFARYDEIADFYQAAVDEGVTDPATGALLALAVEVRGQRVLDLACGHGRIARVLARRGALVLGVDISGALLERARAAEAADPLGVRYLLADVSRPDALVGERFDAVLSNHGLADIDDLDGALKTIGRVLTPEGWFAFSLLHPCFPGWGPEVPSSWAPGAGYYREGWWRSQGTGIRSRVGSTHRMLSTYLNALARAGFALEQVSEPEPGAELGGRPRPPGADPVPVYFAARAKRLSGGTEI